MYSKLSYIFAVLSLFMVSCANKTKDGVSAEASVPSSLSERLSESGGFKQDASGNWVPKSNKRSSFELERENHQFKGSIEKEVYRTGDYEKKSWWGKKEYKVSEYKGDTDGSRFMFQAKQDKKVSPFSGKKMPTMDPYKTNTLEYQSARESDVDAINKPGNDYAKYRQRRFTQPTVIDWEEQRKLSMEQSRSILGR